MDFLQDSESNLILLNFILVGMGMVLSPLLWGIFSRLGKQNSKLTESVGAQVKTNELLAGILKELGDSRVRDETIQGQIKGILRDMDRLMSNN